MREAGADGVEPGGEEDIVSQKYQKKFLAHVEVWVTPRKDIETLHFTERDNEKSWRAAVRHSNGVMEWRWCDSFEDAVAWCENFKGLDISNYIRVFYAALTGRDRPIQKERQYMGALEMALISAGVPVGFGSMFENGDKVLRLAKEYLDKKDTEAT